MFFICTFKILAGNSHNNFILPGKWSYFWAVSCFCDLYVVLHNYQKAEDKINEPLDTRLVAPPSTIPKAVYAMLVHYKKLFSLFLRFFFSNLYVLYVYLFTLTCINFVSGFWLADSHQSPSNFDWKQELFLFASKLVKFWPSPSKRCLHYQSLTNFDQNAFWPKGQNKRAFGHIFDQVHLSVVYTIKVTWTILNEIPVVHKNRYCDNW